MLLAESLAYRWICSFVNSDFSLIRGCTNCIHILYPPLPPTHTHYTGPGLAQDDIAIGDPHSASPVSECNQLHPLLSRPNPSVSPSATPIPKVYLTEGQDQTERKAEILLSVDGTRNRAIGTLQVKPMSHYLLEVPPQQETVALRLSTLGERKCQLQIFCPYRMLQATFFILFRIHKCHVLVVEIQCNLSMLCDINSH